MVIVMEHAASEEQVQKVIETLGDEGYDVHRSSGIDYTVLGAVGAPPKPIDPRLVEVLPGVRQVLRISEPYKLAGRTFKPEDTVVELAGVAIGGTEVIAMAPVRARWRAGSRSVQSRRASPPRGLGCSGEERSSPGPRPTPFRGTARTPSSG